MQLSFESAKRKKKELQTKNYIYTVFYIYLHIDFTVALYCFMWNESLSSDLSFQREELPSVFILGIFSGDDLIAMSSISFVLLFINLRMS